MDERVVKFQGFHPTDFTRNVINEKITELHEESPYGATLRAVFSRKRDQFKAVLTIYSPAGRFFATATSEKLNEVTHKLVEQIRKQLGRWKSRRFPHDDINDLLRPKRSKEIGHDESKLADHAS